MSLHQRIKPSDRAAVLAAGAKIQDDVILLGMTGTLAAAAIELTNIGTNDAVTLNLSNCNIGTVALATCFEYNIAAIATTLDLSHNRMSTAAITDLIDQIYAAIVTGSSHSTLTLDVRGNAVPNANTMAFIYVLCEVGCVVMCDAPTTVTATGVTDPTTAGVYTYSATTGSFVNAGGDNIHHMGTHYILITADTAHTWTGPADSIYGTYTLVDHASIVVS